MDDKLKAILKIEFREYMTEAYDELMNTGLEADKLQESIESIQWKLSNIQRLMELAENNISLLEREE